MRCNATNTIDPIKSKVLMAMYNNLEILCDKRCNELFKLSNIEQHEKDCTKEKCLNKDLCNNIASQ